MNETKKWWESGSVQGGLIVAGADIAGMIGYGVSEDDQQQLMTLVPTVASAPNGSVAVTQRRNASRRIVTLGSAIELVA